MIYLPRRFSVDSVRRWGVKIGVAVMDQGLFSGSNFVINIFLARWLDPGVYGAFSVAFAIYLFFTGFYNALILEPATVLGPANHSGQMDDYIAGQFTLHVIVSGILGTLMTCLGFAYYLFLDNRSELGGAIIGAGIALPAMLLTWLVRRQFYLHQKPGGALLASWIYTLVLLCGGYLLVNTEINSSPFLWFGLMGVAGLASSAAAIDLLRKIKPFKAGGGFNWKQLLTENWNFGRWIVMAVLLYFVATQAQIFLTVGLISLEAAGAWRALQNFILPVTQGINILFVLGMPVLSAEFGRANLPGLMKKGFSITVAMVALAVVNELILLSYGDVLVKYVYADKYAAFTWIIPLLGLGSILTALAMGYSLILRAVQKPEYYLISNAIGAGVAILSGVVMTYYWGLAGVIGSVLLVSAVSVLVNIGYYHIWFSRVRVDLQDLRP